MDIHRAQEIIDSTDLVNVNYRGIPIFIQQVHANNRTVTIFPLDEMNNEQVVELDGLTEEGPNAKINERLGMNKQRAVEIAQSPDMKHVSYNGEQVYIQHVDEQNETAYVFSLEDPQHAFDVQITSLNENELR